MGQLHKRGGNENCIFITRGSYCIYTNYLVLQRSLRFTAASFNLSIDSRRITVASGITIASGGFFIVGFLITTHRTKKAGVDWDGVTRGRVWRWRVIGKLEIASATSTTMVKQGRNLPKYHQEYRESCPLNLMSGAQHQ